MTKFVEVMNSGDVSLLVANRAEGALIKALAVCPEADRHLGALYIISLWRLKDGDLLLIVLI
ncbi:MAG: hypothetical protein ACD_62C00385G0006 [uncultured bacterium]|nr:MAG: hypothetical protein ACD_62C00385G0006 [uncultured bacterium]